MIKEILIYPNKVLKRVSEVVIDYKDVVGLAEDLLDTMYHNNGVGLSAIQIGVPLQVFVLDAGNGPEVHVNPSWEAEFGATELPVKEGCLSFPSIFETVKRWTAIESRSFSKTLQEQRLHKHGLAAQIFQHEFEHLQGLTFMDNMATWRKEIIRKKMKQLKKGGL